MGCIVEEATPDFPIDAVWRAFLTLRAWQAGTGLLDLYEDPTMRVAAETRSDLRNRKRREAHRL